MTVSECLYHLIFYYFFLLNTSRMPGLNAHPNADLDSLPLFEAEVQLGCCALTGFLFCEFTFLLHPPLEIKV